MTFPWLLSNIKDNVNEEPLGRGEITCMIDHNGVKVCYCRSDKFEVECVCMCLSLLCVCMYHGAENIEQAQYCLCWPHMEWQPPCLLSILLSACYWLLMAHRRNQDLQAVSWCKHSNRGKAKAKEVLFSRKVWWIMTSVFCIEKCTYFGSYYSVI